MGDSSTIAMYKIQLMFLEHRMTVPLLDLLTET